MPSIEKYLFQLGGPIFIFTGTLGCILNLIVFIQKTLRKNPCSIYFIAYNLVNFMYIYSSLLSVTLDVGYGIDLGVYNLVLCRLRLYVTLLCNCISPFYLMLASIDRILITSSNARTRQRSTCRLAYICIGVGTLFWILCHIHALIFATIIQLGPNQSVCFTQNSAYIVFLGYYALIKEILTVALMIICGLWSIKNIQAVSRVRVAPILSVSGNTATGTMHSATSKDRQLILMLFIDISIYALCSFIYATFLMYRQITQYYVKSADRIQIEGIIKNVCFFISGIPFCTSCYVNLLVSKTYRSEVKKVLLRNRIICN